MNQPPPRLIRLVTQTAASCVLWFLALTQNFNHAATLGFNFQTRYCEDDAYTGTRVTATAFGIDPSSWQNLAAMVSGVGCFGAPFTLTQHIDANSATDGLNPLPQGAMDVLWTASSAYASGFGGYDRFPGNPGFAYAGNGHRPGEEEVYWGFLRDAANFGPITGQGYEIDLVGLKSVFGDHPYVVQLIAASDAAWSMTNAFIIDATLPTEVRQSVNYANFAPIRDLQDSEFPRGIGGGISTMSGPLAADHLKIVGNTAEHGPGFNNASTIAGFIITDKPVVTMSPRSVFGSAGDPTTLRAIAIGSPPLTLQWRKDGVAIPGANSATYSLGALSSAKAGSYDLVANNAFGTSTSKVATVTVDRLAIEPQPFTLDSAPGNTPHHAVVKGATLVPSNQDIAKVTRTSVAHFAAADNSQIAVPASPDINTPEGAISFWMRSPGTVAGPGTDAAILIDRRVGAGLLLVQNDNGSIRVITSGNDFTSNISVSDDHWHQIIVNYDQTENASIYIYIDGVLDSTEPNENPWGWSSTAKLELGKSHDPRWKAYNGFLDDFRIYNRRLTDDEVVAIPTKNALVADALVLRLNFEEIAPGISLSWQAPTAIIQSADKVEGPYTNINAATSPYLAPGLGGKMFYRYTHVPTSIVSNPYDM